MKKKMRLILRKIFVAVIISLTIGFSFTIRTASAGHLPPGLLDYLPVLLPDGLEWIQQHGNISIDGKAILGSSVGIGTISPSGKLHTEDIQYDVGTGLCPIGYTEGDYDGEGDAADCQAIGIVAQDNGNVGIGTTSPTQKLHISGNTAITGSVGIGTSTPLWGVPLHIAGTGVVGDNGADAINIRYFSDGDELSSYSISGVKSRGTISSPAPVQQDDILFYIDFRGYDGSVYPAAASIDAQVDGTPGLGDMPGRLVFSTIPDGTNTLVQRMVIKNNGNVGIGTTSPIYPLEMGSGAHVTAGGV